MNARFHRNTREALPQDRFPAIFGPYRRAGFRLLPALALIGSLALWAGIGVLLAWRG